MEMQREIQLICGAVRIPDLPGFLKTINKIASENEVIVQGLNTDLIAGERHLHFAVGKALKAVATGTNVAKDPGIEIMRYAAGERQIERSFSIGLHEGENNVVFVLLGTMDKLLLAFSELRKVLEEKTLFRTACLFRFQKAGNPFSLQNYRCRNRGFRRRTYPGTCD